MISLDFSQKRLEKEIRTSGSGQSGSANLSTSLCRITSILTSCDTLTFFPARVVPLISKESKA